MAIQFCLAALGHTMEKGRVVEWYVREGSQVKEGEPLLSVETDKATVDVEAPVEGVLLRIVGKVDEEYAVGATLAWIGEAGEEISKEMEEPAADPGATPPAQRVTPVARRFAERHGIDADALQGSGTGGRVTKEDVQRAVSESQAAAAPTSAEEGVERVPLTGIRRTTVERLAASWSKTPQVTEGIEVDMSACLRARADGLDRWRAAHGVEPTINDVVLKAAAEALKAHPMLNAAFVDGAVEQYRDINLGVAVDTEDGLIVPVVHGADQLGVGDIAKAVSGLAERARTGKLGLEDLEGGTFTVTNLGGFGVDWFTPVLNPPQCGILGVGRVRRSPVAEGDDIAVRDLATFVLSFDHRAVDGVQCARFLARFKKLLENPNSWLR